MGKPLKSKSVPRSVAWNAGQRLFLKRGALQPRKDWTDKDVLEIVTGSSNFADELMEKYGGIQGMKDIGSPRELLALPSASSAAVARFWAWYEGAARLFKPE